MTWMSLNGSNNGQMDSFKYFSVVTIELVMFGTGIWLVPTSIGPTNDRILKYRRYQQQQKNWLRTPNKITKLKLNENKIKLPIIIGHLTSAVINLYDYWLTAATSNKINTKICDISDNSHILFSDRVYIWCFFRSLFLTVELFIQPAIDNSKDLHKSWPNKCDVLIKC